MNSSHKRFSDSTLSLNKTLMSNILLGTLSYNSNEESSQAEANLHYKKIEKSQKAGNFGVFF